MNESLIGLILWLGYVLLLLAPMACTAFLARHFMRGTPLPAGGVWGVYLGCPFWAALISASAAIHDFNMSWVAAPFLLGGALSALWRSRTSPRPGTVSILAGSAAYALLGLAAYLHLVSFERVLQAPFAFARLHGSIRPEADVLDLARALKHRDAYVRWGAAMSLERRGSAALPLPVLQSLVFALADEDERVREHAANTLAGVGPAAAPVAPLMAPLLRDERSRLRVEAFFESLGPKASCARPELVRLLDDSSERVRTSAGKALRAIGSPAKGE